MSDWSDAVEFAIRRSKKNDRGASAAKAAILGLPNPELGPGAYRVYETASKARQAVQNARQRKNLPPIPTGTTGKKEWDKQLAA